MTGAANKPLGWADVDRFSAASAAPRPLAAHPLTLEERVRLANAPRQAGTNVTVRAYPVWGGPWDHMYVEYDDGREQYIYRGGPSKHGVHAEVTPADRSRDRGRGGREIYRTSLPGVRAREAIKPAERHAARVEASGEPYLAFRSNSNLVVGDLTEDQFGRRAGDNRTPGWRPPRFLPDQTRWGPVPRREF